MMKIQQFLLLIVVGSLLTCIQPIDFEVPSASRQVIVEGMIHDGPGPYTVKLNTALDLNDRAVIPPPITNATITLFDDLGNEELMSETTPGVYQSRGSIRGVAGRFYHIEIELSDGRCFQSIPDLMRPAGELLEVKHEFEARTTVGEFGEVNADVFNIYVDADAGEESDPYVRWKFTGTYQVLTRPELHMRFVQGYIPWKSPWPCSGFRVGPGPVGSGGVLIRVGDCECCDCWAQHYERRPQLSDTRWVSDNQFRNVKVGEVPVTNATFHLKYMVQVEQMSMSRQSFEFFRQIRAQKEGTTSLFQPPSGEISGNMLSSGPDDLVTGIFWATQIRKKVIFLDQEDVPYPVTPIDFVTADCRLFYPNASNQPPEGWE